MWLKITECKITCFKLNGYEGAHEWLSVTKTHAQNDEKAVSMFIIGRTLNETSWLFCMKLYKNKWELYPCKEMAIRSACCDSDSSCMRGNFPCEQYRISVWNLESSANWKSEQSSFLKHNFFVFSLSLCSALRCLKCFDGWQQAGLLFPYILLVIVTFLHLTV